MRNPSLRGDVGWAVLGASAAVALAATALLSRADFFLHDDYRSYFMPMFGEISRLVRSGEFPLLTDRIWNGGAILAEYQFGVLNPVSLALMVLIGQMNDLAAAAAVFSLAHIAIFAAGSFLLCRVLGCRRDTAFLAALVAPTSEWIFYWGAGDWIPALTSIAWAPWAWAGLVAASRDARWTPAATAGIAMVLQSGWPFADLALLISLAVAFVALRGRILHAPALAIVCGGLLAAPAILPLAAYLEGSGRPSGPVLKANLDAIIGISTPFMVTQWMKFEGVRDTLTIPMLQVAWWVTPALVTAGWRELWRRAGVRALVLIAAAFAALAVMPEIWQFRWMFRLLPYYQLAMVLLAAIALDEALRSGRLWRRLPVALALGAPLWLALWQDGRMTTLYYVLAAILALVAIIALWIQPRRPAAFMTTLALGHATLFAVVSIAYLGLGGRFPGELALPSLVKPTNEAPLTRFTIFQFDSSPAERAFFRLGGSALERPGVTINGYSSFHHAAFVQPLCLSAFGTAECADAVDRLSRPFAGSSLSFLDLARVEEVRAQRGAYAENFAARHPAWTRQPGAAGAGAFRRPLAFAWPAPVSAAPRDATIADVATRPRQVRFRIETRAGGRVILARAWYPGWRATLDGAPLALTPVGGVFVSAELPPNSVGTLVFSYWPKGLTLGMAAALAGLLLLAGHAALMVRRNKAPNATGA